MMLIFAPAAIIRPSERAGRLSVGSQHRGQARTGGRKGGGRGGQMDGRMGR